MEDLPYAKACERKQCEPQGGGGTRIPNQGLGGGEAEKKKVTSPILMAEVVVDVPNNTYGRRIVRSSIFGHKAALALIL